MRRRQFLAALAGVSAGCSSLRTDERVPTPSATAEPTATAIGTPAATATAGTPTSTPDPFPNSLGTDAFALHLTGVTLRPSIFERFEGIRVVDEPGLQFLVLQTATRVRELQSLPDLNHEIRLTVRLDGDLAASSYGRTLDTDPFQYAIAVPEGEYGSATVVFEVDGVVDTWEVPDHVVRRFARSPGFGIEAFDVTPMPSRGSRFVKATFRVRNRGVREGRCLYTLQEPGRLGTVAHGQLAVPPGGTAMRTEPFDAGSTSRLELDLGTDRATTDVVVTPTATR